MNKLVLFFIFFSLILLFLSSEKKSIHRAVAVIQSDKQSQFKITGTVNFQDIGNNITRIYGQISGLPDGPHGFHIHEYGDIRKGCTSLGGHFNPHNHYHGGPASHLRHVGDLGNLLSHNGTASFDFTDHLVTLSGDYSILGRSIVIHQGKDDLGQGGNAESRRTGNAGPRLGCGIIALCSDK